MLTRFKEYITGKKNTVNVDMISPQNNSLFEQNSNQIQETKKTVRFHKTPTPTTEIPGKNPSESTISESSFDSKSTDEKYTGFIHLIDEFLTKGSKTKEDSIKLIDDMLNKSDDDFIIYYIVYYLSIKIKNFNENEKIKYSESINEINKIIIKHFFFKQPNNEPIEVKDLDNKLSYIKLLYYYEENEVILNYLFTINQNDEYEKLFKQKILIIDNYKEDIIKLFSVEIVKMSNLYSINELKDFEKNLQNFDIKSSYTKKQFVTVCILIIILLVKEENKNYSNNLCTDKLYFIFEIIFKKIFIKENVFSKKLETNFVNLLSIIFGMVDMVTYIFIIKCLKNFVNINSLHIDESSVKLMIKNIELEENYIKEQNIFKNKIKSVLDILFYESNRTKIKSSIKTKGGMSNKKYFNKNVLCKTLRKPSKYIKKMKTLKNNKSRKTSGKT